MEPILKLENCHFKRSFFHVELEKFAKFLLKSTLVFILIYFLNKAKCVGIKFTQHTI